MAPFALLALLLAAVNPDLPIGRTQPPPLLAHAPAPANQTTANPMADSVAQGSLAPSDDYGYVAFCYGAESGYLNLYDRVMPEVERIERAFPGATPIDQALAEYPQLRSESQAHLTAYAGALTAAERSSPQALAPRGLQLIRQGRSTWDGAARATPAQSAQAWMGWSPPEDCTDRATALAERSRPQSAAIQGAASSNASQGAVELDRLANPPALATAPARSIGSPTPAPPQPLALRGSAAAPSVAAPSPQPQAAQGLGVSFVAAPAAGAPAGLGVTFDGSAAPMAGTASPSSAVPQGLPMLIAPPAASPAPDAPTWRGIL